MKSERGIRMKERRRYEEIAADVRAAQSGDAEAMNRILADVQDAVYYTCLRILRNDANAEDATQDVLFAICRKIGTLKEPMTYVDWVNRMTANRCRDLLLKENREVFLTPDASGEDPFALFEDADEQRIPENAIDNAETQRMILELVDALPDEQRMCVMLFYYNEMKTREIADALDVAEGTVKSRLNYARKSIREGVLGYEKQGIKLYGVSPIPFLGYFLGEAIKDTNTTAAAAGIAANVTGAAGVVSAAGAGAAASSGVLVPVMGRLLAAAVSIGLLGGVGFGIFRLLDSRRIDPQPVIEETATPRVTTDAEAKETPLVTPVSDTPRTETPAPSATEPATPRSVPTASARPDDTASNVPSAAPEITPSVPETTPSAPETTPSAPAAPSTAPQTPTEAPATPTEAPQTPTEAPTATPTQEPTWTEWSEEEPPSGAVSESRPQYRYRFTTTKVITEIRVQHPYELMNQIENEMRKDSYDDYAVQSQTQEWRGKRLYKTVETLAEAEAAAAESTDDYRYTYEENGDGQYDVYSETKYVVSSVFFCTDYSEWSDVYPEQVETHAGSLEVDSRQLWRYLR